MSYFGIMMMMMVQMNDGAGTPIYTSKTPRNAALSVGFTCKVTAQPFDRRAGEQYWTLLVHIFLQLCHLHPRKDQRAFLQRLTLTMAAYGQLVTGPPGAGKTTYCHGMHQVSQSRSSEQSVSPAEK